MSFLKTLIVGRPDGLRARLFGTAKAGDASSPSAGKVGGAGRPASRPGPRAPEPEAAEKALGLQKQAPKDVNPPDGYEVVLHKDGLADGQIIEVIIGGTAIAVARIEGQHYAIANTCPHAGGPLGDGKLSGKEVTCPYHGWKYDVTTGACSTSPGVTVRSYRVQTVGDAVCVEL